MRIGIGGSRRLTEEGLVRQILTCVKRRGYTVKVGCAHGIDATVRRLCVEMEIEMTVFGFGKRDGSDWGSRRAQAAELRDLEANGITVVWSAGGFGSYRSRLWLRTQKMVDHSDQVVMICADDSIGSVRALDYAAQIGLKTTRYDR